MEAFLGSSVTKPLARPGVELLSDSVAVRLSNGSHAFALREVLANESIGVLVRAPLPGVVWGREIELGAGGGLDAAIAMKLGPVVGGDGPEGSRMLPDELDGPEVQGCNGAIGKFSDQGESRLPFHQRDDAVFFACTHNGVDFPVTELASPFDGLRSLADHAFVGEFSAEIDASVAFAALLSGTA